MIYKTMLLKNILSPVLTYGVEIFGMNETRLRGLNSVMDKGVRCIVKKGNYCRQRAYEELGIS